MTTNPRGEYPNTYFVQDRSSQEELSRLQIQDQMLTASMGGVLPEQPDPLRFRQILDVGCGTGGWLIEAAKAYPTMTRLVGIDASRTLIEFARTQAEAQHVSDRVEFYVMDALLILEFPPATFDLVNERLGSSFLRTWDWPKLLQECQRVSKPGGVIRLTEIEAAVSSSSPALTRLNDLFLQALYQSGHFFTRSSDGATSELPHLLKRSGIKNSQTRPLDIVHRFGTPQGQSFYEDVRHLFRTLLPFFRQWLRVPEDYEEIYQQALREMQQPDFIATWHLLTAWGCSPS